MLFHKYFAGFFWFSSVFCDRSEKMLETIGCYLSRSSQRTRGDQIVINLYRDLDGDVRVKSWNIQDYKVNTYV